ncbi:hypothetical protein QQP08_026311 [Theobroma cacao]|nr:hypothetical protein QQP08_026311 [Theobroma cacao]
MVKISEEKKEIKINLKREKSGGRVSREGTCLSSFQQNNSLLLLHASSDPIEVGKVVVLGLVVDTVVSLNLGVREKNLFVDKDLLGFASKFKAQLMN